MRIALIGQPNCGKSTLFNQVAGYKAETGNFSGTSVNFLESKVRVMGQVVDVVDLPGTYTLAGTNPAERVVFNYLAAHSVDVIINVLDASRLAHGFELTLELLELGCPMVLGLNMIDEARRLGIDIDGGLLRRMLGLPVVGVVASRGHGVRDLFVAAIKAGSEKQVPARQLFSPAIEKNISELVEVLQGKTAPFLAEVAAIKLLEGDEDFLRIMQERWHEVAPVLERNRQEIRERRGQPAVWVLSGERHAHAAQIGVEVAKIDPGRRLTWQDRLDDVFLHPVWGYVLLLVILFVFFQFIYFFGSVIEEPLLSFFDGVDILIAEWLGRGTFQAEMISGLVQGVSGGVAIVLPYLAPFLLGLGLLEDIGYLPRVAFLMDALMHRLGLHGKAIVPFILGYGCNVPAIMSTRMLEDRRDRFLAAALATLVPCAARLSVVFGLVAFYLGPNLALAIYVFNLLVIALTARFLSNLMPEETPGLILEVPVYRMPTLKSVFNKAWFRIREFVIEAWPVLIIGSIVLGALNYFQWDHFFNVILAPLAWILGLPVEVGVPLIFGILRKELSLLMLRQALGHADLGLVLSPEQMVTFSIFVMFYVPCLATLLALRRELGMRSMLLIVLLTIVIATLAALIGRGFMVVSGI